VSLGVDPSLPQTGLTIYTGPLDTTAGKNSTWSRITTRLSSINYYLAVSISLNAVLALLCIMQRFVWRKEASEHSPDAATETDVECITDVLEAADDESTTTRAPATVACISDTAPITIASSPYVSSSSLEATTSAPTAGVEADSLAPGKSVSYTRPSSIELLLYIIWVLLQVLAAAHRAFYAAQSNAKHDDKGPTIAEYHEETDAALPVASSDPTSPPPCATGCDNKTPPPIECSPLVLSEPHCRKEEQTSANVSPEARDGLGMLDLCDEATVSIHIASFQHD
jgi:hypothetical protein